MKKRTTKNLHDYLKEQIAHRRGFEEEKKEDGWNVMNDVKKVEK